MSASMVTAREGEGRTGTNHLDDAGLRSGARQRELALRVAKLAKGRRGLSSCKFKPLVRPRHGSAHIGTRRRTMYTGRLDFCPRMVVDQSTLETSRRIRGRNHTLHIRTAGITKTRRRHSALVSKLNLTFAGG